MTARDLMSAPVITVGPDTPVSEIAELLTRHRITGVVVVDGRGRALGIVGEGDLLYRVARPHLPPHVELLGTIIYLESPGKLDEQLRRLAGVTAEDLMSTPVYSVAEDTAMEDVASLMLDRNIRRVPVLRDGRPVGMVTRGDVLRHALVGAVRRAEEEEAAQEPRVD